MIWADEIYSELELAAAWKFYRLHRTIGGRRRVQAAICYYRAYH